MMDDGPKKKKRGRSLIFKTCFRPASRKDNGGKILASDDSLVYCDVTGNAIDSGDVAVIEPEVKKPSRGRMSRIFKAVLFDTAMKKKMRGSSKKSSKSSIESSRIDSARTDSAITDSARIDSVTIDSVVSSSVPAEKVGDSCSVNDLKIMNDSDADADNSSTDRSNLLSSRTDSSPLSTSCSSSINSNSQLLTEQRESFKTNSTDDKPPLPSNSLPESQSDSPPAATSDSLPVAPSDSLPAAPSSPPVKSEPAMGKSADKNSSKARLGLIILLVLFILVALWMIYAAIAAESPPIIDSEQPSNKVTTEEEL